MRNVNFGGILIRYFTLLVITIFQANLLPMIFTPLTLYPLLWILQLFGSANLLPLTATIETSKIVFSLVPACIGGSAYYLLLILNLTTSMSLEKRVKSLVFLISSFFILNILRLILFVFLFSEYIQLANALHLVTWYLFSIVLVIGLWFFNVYLFKIKSIPIIDDFKNLFNATKK